MLMNQYINVFEEDVDKTSRIDIIDLRKLQGNYIVCDSNNSNGWYCIFFVRRTTAGILISKIKSLRLGRISVNLIFYI